MKTTGYLGKQVKIEIDRAMGTKHPKHGFLYEVNYGFVPGTKAPDGDELDAYLLGVDHAVEEYEGKCIAIIHRTNDVDDKLVITTPEAEALTDDEILKLVNFQEQFFENVIIRI